MADKPEILKRKRSRPSDWWAVQSGSSNQVGDDKSKKLKKASTNAIKQTHVVHINKDQNQKDQKGSNEFPKFKEINRNNNDPSNSKNNKKVKRANLNRAIKAQISKKISREQLEHQLSKKKNRITHAAQASSEGIEKRHIASSGKLGELDSEDQNDFENTKHELRFQEPTRNESDLKRSSKLDDCSFDSEQSSYTDSSEIEDRYLFKDVYKDKDTVPFKNLASLTKPVSRYLIESKWNPLPSSCVDCVEKQLRDIRLPIIVSYKDSRSRKQSGKALKSISQGLIRKISKDILFPLGSRRNRKIDLDFNKISEYNRCLENQLTPALHANSLLNTALSQELKNLRIEKEILVDLETNAKKENSLRNESARKLHPLLQASYNDDTYYLKQDVGLEPKSSDTIRSRSSYMTQLNDNSTTLIQDIQYHVASIRNNLDQLHGVSETISRTKAALQTSLFNHLDIQDYQKILLGEE